MVSHGRKSAKVMNLLLIRDAFSPTTTLGKLFVNGAYQCETLEDCDRKLEAGGKKVEKNTAIPRGTYSVIIDYSNRFRRDMPNILAVLQFEGIRIHSGNTAADTEGCILVGKLRINDNSIGYSRDAFGLLYAKLEAAYERNEEITIEVR